MTLTYRTLSILLFVLIGIVAPLEAQTEPDRSSPTTEAISLDQEFLNRSWVAPVVHFDQAIQTPTGAPPTPRHTGIKTMIKMLGADVKHLPSRENLLWVGIGSGLALGVHPVDDNINRALVGDATAGRVFKLGEILGEPFEFPASAFAPLTDEELKEWGL